jgi:hypothetical protein
MLKQSQTLLLTLVSLTLTAALASAQPREVVRDEITLRGTVEAVDHTARTVRIRGDLGNVVTLDVPESVTRFDQVKVGDVVTVAYYDRVNIRPKPLDEAAVDRTSDPTTTPTPGALPGATVAKQRVSTVTITGWDPATRTVTYTGPKGTSYTRRLLETTDPRIMTGLKVGDRVDVTWTEATRISVQSGAEAVGTMGTAAAAATAGAVGTAGAQIASDDFRHRFTISALWGVDNQFSGKMIQEATGQTTFGAPINLNETSYDDVYGRMGLFRVGVGYRTTPRTEAVVNFIYSNSAADVVQVGTVGSIGAPLFVQFDDFSYWGVEGGQRFFFARVRFTPYVGYLIGLNRYGDIRGVFVNTPAGVQPPGLVAQDGKFFEKSWAFSLGPTGGVLVGLGPFEVMGEVQFRFMGGLSDVDWLVEQGLRDINSESSRWSFPVTVGARIRF